MKKYFLTGLVTLLPLAVTVWFIHFIINFLTKPFMGIVSALLKPLLVRSFGIITSVQMVRTISQITILAALIGLVYFIGFVGRRYFFSSLLRFGDRLLYRIPLVNKVYKTSKDIVLSFFSADHQSFKQVVMIPFPSPECYCIGLIARNAPNACSKAEQDELVSVFIPTTPNPTTGFLVMCYKSKLILLNMKNEEAIKYIVSCGVVVPRKEESLKV